MSGRALKAATGRRAVGDLMSRIRYWKHTEYFPAKPSDWPKGMLLLPHRTTDD
jgi:hypothetical protein